MPACFVEMSCFCDSHVCTPIAIMIFIATDGQTASPAEEESCNKVLPSGLPIRPSGMSMLTRCFTLSGTTSVIGVSVKPGNTAFTRIP